MNKTDVGLHRLSNQNISHTSITNPHDVVHTLGAVQAQDYLGSLWAVGLRTQDHTEKDIEKAIEAKEIIRTWPMRGTLHFVSPEDIRWMLKLLTPRVISRSKSRYRDLELDESVFSKSRKVLSKAMSGGKKIKRNDILSLLEENNIKTSEYRGLHIVGHLAQEGLICFGPRDGKQHTFVLLEEWVPKVKEIDEDEALAHLTLRYFSSHGPATIADFSWWSGLTHGEVKKGIDLVQSKLHTEKIDEYVYWMSPDSKVQDVVPSTYLLPAFDEYTVSYKNRDDVLDPQFKLKVNAGGGIFNPIIVIDGKVVGTWKRTFKKNSVVITLSPFAPFSNQELKRIEKASQDFGTFLHMPVVFS